MRRYSNESQSGGSESNKSSSLIQGKVSNRSNRGSYLSLESETSLGKPVGMSRSETESLLLDAGSPTDWQRSSDLLINGSIGIDKIRLSVPLLLDSTSLPSMLVRLLGRAKGMRERF